MALGFWQTLATVYSDGVASTAAARASLLQGNAKNGLFTLPANQLRVGDSLYLRANGTISSVVTTPGTARFDLSFGVGGTAVMDSSQIALNIVAQSSIWWQVEMEGIVRVASSQGNMLWSGYYLSPNAQGSSVITAVGPAQTALTVALPILSPPGVGANVDMTISNILDFNFTQTVNTGTITLKSYTLAYRTATGF